LEQRYIDETIASIRLRTRHHDPYEEWEKQTRKDALVSFFFEKNPSFLIFIHIPISQKTARKELADTQAHLHELQDRKHVAEQKRLELGHAKQLAEIQSVLDRAKEVQQNEETNLKKTWKLRDQLLWERIEAGIKVEEERLAKRLEEERKVREEEDRKRKEEELKKRLNEEKRLQEENAKKKAEEEKKRLEEETQRKEKEAEEKRKKQANEMERRTAEEVELRAAMSFNPANDDWRVARQNLLVSVKSLFYYPILPGHIQSLKQPVRYVKSNKELKSAWGTLRRQIVPKIGQLTNDPRAISLIVRLIVTQKKIKTTDQCLTVHPNH
jgi:nucleoporin GLE1